jgi:predicted acylesterase/phospholipase RssA
MNIDTIENVVLSGGGPVLFIHVGILHELESLPQGTGLACSKLKRIYGTSAGSLIGLFLCIGIELTDLKEYMIGRPWEKIFDISPSSLFSAYHQRGILTKNVIYEIFKPVIEGSDLNINMDITFMDLFSATGKHFSCFATNIHEKDFSNALTEFSYQKTPEMKVLDAVFYSSCLPILFQPEIIDDTCCYADGGIVSNFPIDRFFKNHPEVDTRKVLGIQKKSQPTSIEPISKDDSIFKYVSHLLNFAKRYYNYHTTYDDDVNEKIKTIQHILIKEPMNIELIYTAIHCSSTREELVSRGSKIGKDYVT